jgi:hypothetical protein
MADSRCHETGPCTQAGRRPSGRRPAIASACRAVGMDAGRLHRGFRPALGGRGRGAARGRGAVAGAVLGAWRRCGLSCAGAVRTQCALRKGSGHDAGAGAVGAGGAHLDLCGGRPRAGRTAAHPVVDPDAGHPCTGNRALASAGHAGVRDAGLGHDLPGLARPAALRPAAGGGAPGFHGPGHGVGGPADFAHGPAAACAGGPAACAGAGLAPDPDAGHAGRAHRPAQPSGPARGPACGTPSAQPPAARDRLAGPRRLP